MSDTEIVETVAKARELASRATPGEWRVSGVAGIITNKEVFREHDGAGIRCGDKCIIRGGTTFDGEEAIGILRNGDAAFIAASRELVPQLCDIIDTQNSKLEELRRERDEARDACKRWEELMSVWNRK